MLEDYREIGDIPATRQAIWNSALEAAASLEPVSNTRYTLGISDVRWQGADTLPKSAHKKALLNGSYLTRKLAGTWTLTDNATGRPVARRRSIVAHVPYITDLGTFVRGGNDYTLSHQLRLKPGVYTRWLDNGELEAHVNVSKGLGHKVYLDPESGIFKLKLGQASVPAVDALELLGADPKQIQQAWGSELYRQNTFKRDPKALNKLYEKISYGKGEAQTPHEKALAIQRAFMQMGLDPEVSKVTLGQPYDHVNANVILDTTAKLLRINKGEQDTDSRDDMAFQRLYGPEDLIADKIRNSQNLMRQYLWKASARNTLDKIPPGAFDANVDAALIGTGLGMPIEGVNPIEMYDNQSRVTRLGEGGIASLDAIPASARNVHPSQMGLIDPIRTPESLKVGVDARMAAGVRKGRDGQMYTCVLDRQGRKVWKSAVELAQSTVAFPNALNSHNRFIPVVQNGRMLMLPKTAVEYTYPTMQSAQHATGQMVPLASNVKGQRAVMAARFLTQALPLVQAEAPLVQSGIPDELDKSYEELYGEKCGAIRARESCQVVSVAPDSITVQTAKGEKKTIDLYRDLVFNRKTGFNQTPVVEPGQQLKPGQLLARSNFTDDKGTTALGMNARVAFLPFRGLNYEDGLVVSESFAKRCASQHYYKNRVAGGPEVTFNTARFVSLKPGLYTKEQLKNFTEDGVIKPGTAVNPGDPLILALNKVDPTEAQKKLGRKVHFRDASLTWDHHDAGVVTDVYHDAKGAQVIVKSQQELRVADKLSGRYGNKGTISGIIPDAELPTLPDGSKPEVLYSPLAIVGRVNPGFPLETALGKIAKLTGKRYAIKDFGGTAEDMAKFVMQEAKKYGVKDVEDMFDDSDPDRPKIIPHIFNGYSYMMKLHHSAESKAQGRGLGSYTTDSQPAKGGEDGAKRIGMLELSALLSHGATQNITDLKYIKGQENLDYWRQYMAGYNPPTPRIPYVYDKFVNFLKGSGINVKREGPRLNIMALTARDVDMLTQGRELKGVKDARTGLQTLPTVSWEKGLKALPGGLFDPEKTGGHSGNRWSYIQLGQKYPNPVMEQPLRFMLNLTEKEFRDVLAGKKTLNTGTGPEALYKAASSLSIENELIRARNDMRSGKRTYRDNAIKRIGYLKAAERLKQEPKDWFMDRVPVLPPFFRPVSQMGPEKLPLVTDPNYLYKQLFDDNQAYVANRRFFGDENSGELGLAVYDSFKAVTGLGDPTAAELKQKEVKGLLKSIFGAGPKYSMMQTRLLGTPVDMAGRGVISVNPDYDMDTCGIPEDMAWETYKPFVIRGLRRHGRAGMQAMKDVEDRTPLARKLLIEEMESRPVLMNRAPTLHKFGIVALKPQLVKGDSIRISPFVCNGFSADFDGNCCDFDTVINLKIPKSDVDDFHTPSPMKTVATQSSKEDKILLSMKIGELPHSEEYRTDRNGAKVYSLREGVEVLACDSRTGEAGYYPVTAVTVEENCPVQEVTISSRKVIVSGNESLVGFNPDTGALSRITPEEGRNRLIPVFRQDPLPFGSFGDRDFGWWVGAFLSDGWCSGHTVGYAKLEAVKREEFVRISRKLHENFTVCSYAEKKGSNKLHLNSPSFAEYVRALNLTVPGEGRGALRKIIPQEMLQNGSEDFLWGLLSGLLDGAGTLTMNNSMKNPRFTARFSTSSPYLRDSLSALCYRLGLRFSITGIPPRGSRKEAYGVCLSAVDLYAGRTKLSVVGAHEMDRLRWLGELPKPRESRDWIPVSHKECELLTPELKAAHVVRMKKGQSLGLNRYVLERYLDILERLTPELYTRVKNTNTLWFPVSTVKALDSRTVYDLLVPDAKVFCANLGVIIQDTMVFHVPTTPEAVKEAYEKMLPSRNLLAPGDFKAMPVITKEHLIGLYEGTRPRPGAATRNFRSVEDVLAAWRRGDLNPAEKVRVLN